MLTRCSLFGGEAEKNMDLGMHVDATVYSDFRIAFPFLDRIPLEMYWLNWRRSSLGIYD